MSVLRSSRGRFAARIMALFLPLFTVPVLASEAQAADPPTTQPDSYSLYWEAKFYTVLPVLNNDTSSDGGRLAVVAKTKSSSTDSPVRIKDGQLQIELCACDQDKTLTLQYKAGEGDAVSDWTSVSVVVKHIYPVKSHRLRHHRAKFVNKNPFRVKVTIYYHSFYRHRKNKHFKIAPNSSAVIKRNRDGQRILYQVTRRPHNWGDPVTAGWM